MIYTVVEVFVPLNLPANFKPHERLCVCLPQTSTAKDVINAVCSPEANYSETSKHKT